jgi:hypothetical protein
MKEFLETPLGKSILGIVVIAIWGINVINFSELSSGDTPVTVQQVSTIDLSELNVPEKAYYEYDATGRDPFKPIRSIRQEPDFNPTDEVEIQQIQLPGLILNGIVDGSAVIMDEQGTTYILDNKEKFLDDIQIIHIWTDSVLVEYLDEHFTLKLN